MSDQERDTHGQTVDLSPKEKEEVVERGAPRAAVVFETVRREGEIELNRPALSLALSGLAAGLSMGFSMVGEGLLRTLLPEAKWAPLVDSLGYTLGFLIVVIGRQQLFTENTVTAILPLLDSPHKRRTLVKVARLWSIVLVLNLVGAFLFSYVVSHSAIFSEEARATFLKMGLEAAKPDFGTIVLRGIAAGWLVALMVWLLPGADTSRVVVIIIITYVVGLGSLSHIIAGSVEVFYVVATGGLSFGEYLANFLLPVFIGNCIGGGALVALLNYGQVVAEGPSENGMR